MKQKKMTCNEEGVPVITIVMVGVGSRLCSDRMREGRRSTVFVLLSYLRVNFPAKAPYFPHMDIYEINYEIGIYDRY